MESVESTDCIPVTNWKHCVKTREGAVAQPVHADTMHGVTRFLQSDIALHDARGHILMW